MKAIAEEYTAPIAVMDILSLEDEAGAIEERYGCRMDELWEGDLCEIVHQHCGIMPDSAQWDSQFDCIAYEYYRDGRKS